MKRRIFWSLWLIFISLGIICWLCTLQIPSVKQMLTPFENLFYGIALGLSISQLVMAVSHTGVYKQ